MSPEYKKLKDSSGKFLTSDKVDHWKKRTDTYFQSDSYLTWKDTAGRFLMRENVVKPILLTLAWIAAIVFLYECLLKPPLRLLDSHTALPYSQNAAYLLTHIAWPIAMIVTLAAFKQPLSLFLASIGQHATKLSAWQFTIEFSDISQLKPLSIPTLNDINQMTPTAWTSDSSGQLFEQIKDATAADYAIVDLGNGKSWLTSRLFIFAVMLERMRDLKCVVFLESSGTTHRRFIGVASPSKIRWALAQRSPWLEAAYTQASASLFAAGPTMIPAAPSPILSQSGALISYQASNLVSAFLTSIQNPIDPVLSHFAANEWVRLDGSLAPAYWERAYWLDEAGLRTLLNTSLLDEAVPSLPDDPPSEQAKKVLRRTGTYIALVDGKERFKGLVNRQLLLETLGVRLSQSESLGV